MRFKKAIFYLMTDLKNLDAEIINLVHDEIIVECKEEIVDQVKTIINEAEINPQIIGYVSPSSESNNDYHIGNIEQLPEIIKISSFISKDEVMYF